MKRLALVLMACALFAAARSEAVSVNDPAPDFQLNDFLGGHTSLASQKGKVLFVHFWASWCTPCKEEFPKLNELAVAYDEKDFAILAVTVDKAQANIQKFLSKYVQGPLKIKVLRDPEGKVAQMYRNRAMPITYVVDPAGVIRFVHMGFQSGDEARWRDEIEQLRSRTTVRGAGL